MNVIRPSHPVPPPTCAVEVTISLIDGKWKPIILFHLFSASSLRFTEIARRLPRVSDRILARTLRELEQDGLVTRTVSTGRPVKVEYALSADGRSLVPVLEAMSAWGHARNSRAAAAR